MAPVWYWMILALILLIVEVKTATLNFLFLAIAAALTGGAIFLGLGTGWPSYLTFGLLSLVGILTLRKRIRAAMTPSEAVSIDVNHLLVSTATIDPGAEATLDYQGSFFQAVNIGHTIIRPGDRIRIVKTESIKLMVEKA